MLRSVLCVLALLLFSVGAVNITIPASSLEAGVVAGSPFNISWANADGPVALLLRNATSNTAVSVIGFDLTGFTSYLWTPPTSLANGVYIIEIGDSNTLSAYSTPFNLRGGGFPVSSQLTLPTSASSASSASQSNTSLRLHTHTGSWTHTGTPPARPTCTSTGSCSGRPPPPPICTTSCMRNLNDTRVTHAASTEASASTSTTKSISKSTQSSSLSESTKVAIGVGATVGSSVILILVMLTFCHGRRVRRASAADALNKSMMQGAVGREKPEASVEMDAGLDHHILEIDGRRRDLCGRENG